MFIKLSPSERLLIHRRRLGLTQAQAARKLKMPVHIYARVENGKLGPSQPAGHPCWQWLSGPATAVESHERCLVMRRRCGKTQTDVAKELKCSRYWLNQMEIGNVPCDTLLWYWEH